ncbi:hypothetical protein [Salipiger sp. PrR002]|uniref:hypothetical protein n=1 Tax=Salipiger sp. PrR002 TaxID=2706489 RepID=UPI0013B6AA0F|nr:hypothetical protein [Salipiger sp. PrR002]NDW01097.1 hypothetical protein [Salipiger sp. PrR002]NDW57900.1 hypothetical protein [Salipiger sp. PrR004]
MSDDPKPEKRKRSRVVRTSHALPNAAEHAKASSRLAGATARYAGRATPEPQEPKGEPDANAGVSPALAPASKESPATSKRPQPKRRAQPKAAAWQAAATEEAGASAKKNVRGFVVWLPADMARLEALAVRLGTSVDYLEKALMKQARKRYLDLDHASALRDSTRLKTHLELTRTEGSGGLFVNAYSDPEIVRALRAEIGDPLDLIADARIIGALFRLYGLDALALYERKAAG